MIVSCGSSDNISIDKSSPKIKLSVGVNDKSVFGVVNRIEDDKVLVNSSGEGGVWVSSEGGNLQKGDYISSSSKSGYGMKQSDDLLHNYTIGKITCDCDFGNVGSLESKTVDGVTMCFVGCKYLC